MPNGWADIDWNATRPELSDVSRSHQILRYEPVRVAHPAVDRMLRELRAINVNGGALFGRFRVVEADDVFHWFASRNRFAEFDFFDHSLPSRWGREALPELRVHPTLGENVRFENSWSGTLTLDGELAA